MQILSDNISAASGMMLVAATLVFVSRVLEPLHPAPRDGENAVAATQLSLREIADTTMQASAPAGAKRYYGIKSAPNRTSGGNYGLPALRLGES